MKKIVLLITIFANLLLANNAQLIAVANSWNRANSTKDVATLSRLYASKVLYYRSLYDANKVLADKVRLFNKYPNFTQSIKNIQVKGLTSNLYTVSFDKYVQDSPGQVVKVYPSYLMLRVESGKIVIAEEGDKVTDINLAKKKNIKRKGQISGNFDGDATIDSAWASLKNCKKDSVGYKMCDCYLEFSNGKTFNTGECLGEIDGMSIRNETDLNGDGIDEIGLIRDWPTSAWRSYQVYSPINAKQILDIEVHTDADVYRADLVKKDPKRKGYIMYRFFGMNENGEIDFDGKRWISKKLK